MFWVYILRCADDSYYTGHTDNLEARVGLHQSGECVGYTHHACLSICLVAGMHHEG